MSERVEIDVIDHILWPISLFAPILLYDIELITFEDAAVVYLFLIAFMVFVQGEIP